MYVILNLNRKQPWHLASSLKNPSVFFSLQITPYVVPTQDIIIDTQEELSYTYPIKKQQLIIVTCSQTSLYDAHNLKMVTSE